jgi:hypothetical protein
MSAGRMASSMPWGMKRVLALFCFRCSAANPGAENTFACPSRLRMHPMGPVSILLRDYTGMPSEMSNTLGSLTIAFSIWKRPAERPFVKDYFGRFEVFQWIVLPG